MPEAPTVHPPLRRPLLAAAISFSAGTLLSFHAALHAAATLAAGLLLVAGSFGIPAAPPRLRSGLRGLGIALAACALATFRTADIREGAPLHRAALAKERVAVVGLIARPPERMALSDLEPGLHALTLRLETLDRDRRTAPVSATIRLLVRDDTQRWQPEYGDRIRATARMEIHPNLSFARHGLAYRGWSEVRDVEVLESGAGNRLFAACWRLRARCAERLSRGLEAHPDRAGVLHALLLGYREALPRPYHETFAATGMLHVFAVSGLHVGIVGFIVLGFARLAGLSQPRWFVVLAPALILYTILTGLNVSAVRACTMALCLGMAPAWSRKPDAPSALGFAALLILLAEPRQIGDVGFVFSFITVSGLILLYPPLFHRLSLLPPAPDPWAPQPNRAGRFASLLVRYGLGLAAASAAAWIASAPLTAYFFNRFSPIGLLGNLVVIPAAFAVVALGSLTLVAGFIAPGLGDLFAALNRPAVGFLLGWVEGLSAIPGGHRFVASPPALAVVLFYALLLGWMRSGPTGRGRWALAGGLAAVALLAAGIRDDRARIEVIQVADGQAVFVDVPGQSDLLVNAGPAFHSQSVLRHLRSAGVNRLRALVLTHPGSRVAGGAADILAALPVRELWLAPAHRGSDGYREILALARARGLRVVWLTAGAAGELPGDLTWEVLHPPARLETRRAADASLVLRLSREGGSALLTGSAGEDAERRMLAQPIPLAAEVLVSGWSARENPFSREWLEAVGPAQVVLSSASSRWAHGPPRERLDAIEAAGARLWRLDPFASVRVELLRKPGSDGPWAEVSGRSR